MTKHKTGNPVGRPSQFSLDTAQRIIDEMINGKDIVTICEAPDMPHRSTVYNWLDLYPDFSTQYRRAKEGLADVFAKKILDMAAAATPENAAADSLRLRAWTWAASRYAPRSYSEKVVTEQATQLNVQINNNRSPANLSNLSQGEKAELKRLLEKVKSPIALIEDS